jgi:DNA-binding transcriptional LysR family regulator
MLSARMPDLAALQMLAAVRELGSLSSAAHRLGLSQQGVSSRMRSLEAQVGAPLLARTPRGSTLTQTGALIADWAAEVLAAAERLDAGIASVRADSVSRLHVAASQTIAEYLLPQWLVALRRQQESLGLVPTEVQLSVSNSAGVSDLVRSGAAPLGFIESPNIPADLASRTVRHDDLVLVVAPEHRWATRRSAVTLDELAATPLVTREQGSGTRDALEHLLTRSTQKPMARPAVELSTTAAVRSAIAAGTAPGVLGELAVRDDLALHRLTAVAVAGPPLRRPLTAIWRTGSAPPAGAARDLAAFAAGPGKH